MQQASSLTQCDVQVWTLKPTDELRRKADQGRGAMWYVLVSTSHAEVPSLKKAGRVRVRCMEGDVLCTCLCFPAPGYPFRILAFAACGGAPRHQHQALVAQHAHPGTLQALPECHLDCTGAWILVLSQPLSSKDWFGRFDTKGSQCSRTHLAVLVS